MAGWFRLTFHEVAVKPLTGTASSEDLAEAGGSTPEVTLAAAAGDLTPCPVDLSTACSRRGLSQGKRRKGSRSKTGPGASFMTRSQVTSLSFCHILSSRLESQSPAHRPGKENDAPSLVERHSRNLWTHLKNRPLE